MTNNILVIPNIHECTSWREPLKHIEDFKKVIFLGNYIIPTSCEDVSFKKSFADFKYILELKRNNVDKVVLLLGNYDIRYLWPNHTDCHAGSDETITTLLRITYRKNRDIFSIAYQEHVDGQIVLFSHAGITKGWLKDNIQHIPWQYHDCITGDFGHVNYDVIHISLFCDWLNSLILSDVPGILADISRSKGGIHNYGSIVWADVTEHYDSPYDFAYQFFGHSQSCEPMVTEYFTCLGCQKAFVYEPKKHSQRSL